MHATFTDEQFQTELSDFTSSAFRLELQRAYTVGDEQELFDGFLAGQPQPPDTRDDFRAYYDSIRRKTEAGITVERVRLVDSPPTDYQRWTRYMDRWNIEAGEVIHYLQRKAAKKAKVTKAFGGRDWWLLDDQRLILMTFKKGRRTNLEITTDKNELQQARSWRDLAITTARGEN